jgi:hypothetical protein
MDLYIPGVYGVVVECWVGHENRVPVVLVVEERDHQRWLIYYNYVDRRDLQLVCAGLMMAENAWPSVLPLWGVISEMANDTLGVEHNVVMVLERMVRHVLFVVYQRDSRVPADMWEQRRVVRLRLFWQRNRSSAAVVRDT